MRKMTIQMTIRTRVGEYEVEISGLKEEVMEFLGELEDVLKTLTPQRRERSTQNVGGGYPMITPSKTYSEAIIKLLSTSWGRTPRTLREIREALEANAMHCPKTTLSGVLIWLVKKGKVKRYKTKKGYVYYLVHQGE